MVDTPEERKIILKAKQLLMKKYNLTEIEAYAHIRKTATDNRLKKVEIARQILAMNEVSNAK